MPAVLQDWVCNLTYMKQSVLLTALRGPDGIHKDHPVKQLLRWYRRCVLVDAFSGEVIMSPYLRKNAASFTGPVVEDLRALEDKYLRSVDEIPHHFQLHFMHGVEIIGYDHPTTGIRDYWKYFYYRIVGDAHLNIETREQMNKRLGDNEAGWLQGEQVTAK